MNNLVQRVLTLAGAAFAAVAVFLLATVGFVVALVALVVLAVVVFVVSRRRGSMSRFVFITNQPPVSPTTPREEKNTTDAGPAVLYELSPEEYTARDKNVDIPPKA